MRRTKGRKKKSQREISNTVHRRFGYLQLEKGRQEVIMKDGSTKNANIIMWDLVENCTKENCKMYDICHYMKRADWDEKLKRCAAQSHYLRAVYRAINNKIGDKMDDADYLRMGLELMPLYNMLFKMKFYEYTIKDVVVETQKTVRANPVFKEIRETITTIERIWKALGSRKNVSRAKDVGENSFYEALLGTAPEPDPDDVDEEDGTGLDFGEETKPKKRDLRVRKDKWRKKRPWGWESGKKKEVKSRKVVVPYSKRDKVDEEEYTKNPPKYKAKDGEKRKFNPETRSEYKKRMAKKRRRTT